MAIGPKCLKYTRYFFRQKDLSAKIAIFSENIEFQNLTMIMSEKTPNDPTDCKKSIEYFDNCLNEKMKRKSPNFDCQYLKTMVFR
jgi:hypothetical protein